VNGGEPEDGARVLGKALHLGVDFVQRLLGGFEAGCGGQEQLAEVLDKFGALLRIASIEQRLARFGLRELGHWLELGPADGGLHVAGVFRARGRDVELAARAAARGIQIPPLSRYFLEEPQQGLVFGYADMRTVAPNFEPLERGGTVIHYDHRGGGRSTLPGRPRAMLDLFFLRRLFFDTLGPSGRWPRFTPDVGLPCA
jgi:hypothetical protein